MASAFCRFGIDEFDAFDEFDEFDNRSVGESMNTAPTSFFVQSLQFFYLLRQQLQRKVGKNMWKQSHGSLFTAKLYNKLLSG